MNEQAAYEELVRRSRERTVLATCLELLGWDEVTYMPRGGVANRGAQLAHLSGLYHQASTDPQIAELLDLASGAACAADPLSPAAVNLRLWRRDYERNMRLPRSLVEELAAVTTTAQQVWSVARQENDYGLFRPWLTQIIHLKQCEGECLANGGTPYDALLAEFEPSTTVAELNNLFRALRPELGELLTTIVQTPARGSRSILKREYPVDRQKIFAEAAAADLGFDFQRGRLDATTHPFYSPIGPGDCRVTTRYNSHDFCEAFFSMLHEIGHGLYEQGIDPAHYGTPVGETLSMSMHESQSRLWERFLGTSRPFWKHFFPRAREVFHDSLHGVSLNDFYRAINHVQPGLNRVRADAVTYDMHIMLRFDLEQVLLSGELAADDLPGAWNAACGEYLGVIPGSDAEGCLQDGHWAAGQFGYFPAYTLGNVYGAQLYEQVRRDLPGLDESVAAGDFTPLHAWLRVNIYQHGQRYAAPELLERVTGSPPDHRPLVRLLRASQAEILGL